MRKLLPPMKEIPDEFKRGNTVWNTFQSDWFFKGIKKSTITEKLGIDKNVALSHLGAIQASFDPPHEHKEAGVAYLASLWFESYKPEKK